jgi:hypothetical protein
MNASGSDASAGQQNRNLVDTLRRSKLFRSYENVFSEWSGGLRSTKRPMRKPTAPRTACLAGSTPPRLRLGLWSPPDPTERGFKDTVKANPGQFTTIRAKYDLPTERHRASDLCLSLPHTRARRQRHDAAIYGRCLTVWGAHAPRDRKLFLIAKT